MIQQFAIREHTIELELMATEQAFQNLAEQTATRTATPTTRLLDAVADWLTKQHGLAACSRSLAWQVWWAVYERIDILRRRTERQAEIAYWFKIDPFSLTDEQQIGLLANLPRVKAQGTLHDGNYPPTAYELVYHLTLLATGDEAAAQRAKAGALERWVDSQMAKGRKH